MDTNTIDRPNAGIEDTTEIALPIKDDIAVAKVRQTFGEAKPRYYVMMVGGGVPTRPHGSRFYAEKEAKRLAVEHPDQTFHVLKVKSSFQSKTADNENALALANLKLGQFVVISPNHFRFANATGEVIGFTPVGAVEVRLDSGETRAFAPKSVLYGPAVNSLAAEMGRISEQEPGA